MNKELYKIAVKACMDVYKDNIDLGTTEYKFSFAEYQSETIQVLAIAGSNERKDWLKNFNLWSTKGIKKVAVDAARELERLTVKRCYGFLVCGHSKSGPTAIAFKRLFPGLADWCVAFCPARSLRYWADRKMENTTIFIDPDDPVPKVGFINFGHPKCERVILPEDKKGLDWHDHLIGHIYEFVEQMD